MWGFQRGDFRPSCFCFDQMDWFGLGLSKKVVSTAL
jgi:hypothetical protein